MPSASDRRGAVSDTRVFELLQFSCHKRDWLQYPVCGCAGHLGRFGRHILGALLAFDHPLGIGPLQFSKYFPEDPHNSFLDAFMAGGWLGGFTFFALVLVTLAIGLRHVFARTPWQATYIGCYAAFVGEVGESYIIDVQHWRHYYLIMGMVWGLLIAGRGWLKEQARVGAAAPGAARLRPGAEPAAAR